MRGEGAETSAGSGVVVALALWGMGLLLGPPWAPTCQRPHACAFPSEGQRRESGILEVNCSQDAVGGSRLNGPARLLFGLPLDLNRATAGDLESLPGIGPGRAQAIVRARCAEKFHSLQTLERVRGIGPRTVDGLWGWAVAREAPDCPTGDAESTR
jgi:competence protein ComEA